ncbi:MAG TPA: FG-GAP-like repeat-containing protein [Thermoanaerobaculia bacterium]|nr:FG-GAP-like repeat-containing protein [Thermoanaerobaculia bacterium]
MRIQEKVFLIACFALLGVADSKCGSAEPCITAAALQTRLQASPPWLASPMASDPGIFSALETDGAMFMVDPRLVLAIARQESGYGANVCTAFNAWNWFHCQADGTCKPTDSVATRCMESPFSSWEDGIETVTSRLKLSYFKNGRNTIDLIGARYCPIGQLGCDVWVNNVKTFYTDLGGSAADVSFSTSCAVSPPTFAPKFDIPTGVEPLGLVVADLDGDHRTDIAVTIYNHGNGDHLTIFRNTGLAGHLQFDPLPIDVPTGAGPEGIAAFDLNNDGKVDLVTANPGNSTITVLHNFSTSGFIDFEPVPLSLPSPSTPHRVVVADFDHDGLPDIIVTSNNGLIVSVFHHAPDPNTIAFDYRTDFQTSNFLDDLAVADIDHDQKPDILVPLTDVNKLIIFQNLSTPGSVQATSLTPLATGSVPRGIAVGDLNNDQLPDVLVAATGGIEIFQNHSSPGSFDLRRTDVLTATNPEAVAIGDLAKDNLPDVVVANSSDNTLTVLHNTTSGQSVTLTPLQPPLATGLNPINLVLGDVDSDGWPDIVTSNHAGNCISIFLNTSGPPQPASAWMQTSGPDLTNSNFTAGLVTTTLGEVFASTNRSCQDSSALGVLRSTDQGASWTQLNLGLTSTNVGSLALSKGNNLFAGSHDGIFRYDRTLATWEPSGLSGQTIIMLVATQNGLFAADSCYCRGLYQSLDEGATWQPTLGGLPGCVNAFVQDGSGNSFAGTGTSGVFKLPAGGTSWQAVNSGLPTSNVSSLALDAGGNLFMGGPAGLFRMNQGAAQWQQITSGLPSDGIQRIAFGSGARVFVGTFSHGIYVSRDGGSTWSEDNSGIANVTPTVGAFAKDNQGYFYVSVGSIVYRSTSSQ